jgi:hypothetical protein
MLFICIYHIHMVYTYSIKRKRNNDEDVIGGATNKIQINDKDMSKVINETANDIFGALKKRKLAPEYFEIKVKTMIKKMKIILK